MSALLAIDPGYEQSAFVLLDRAKLVPMDYGVLSNLEMADWLTHESCSHNTRATELAIEMIASYGMPVGFEIFHTCVWIGRFIEAWGLPYTLVYRRDVKLHLCGSSKAKDGNVRAALLDRFGGKGKALGTKKAPGPLHGMAGDVWAALAVAITHAETPSKNAVSRSEAHSNEAHG